MKRCPTRRFNRDHKQRFDQHAPRVADIPGGVRHEVPGLPLRTVALRGNRITRHMEADLLAVGYELVIELTSVLRHVCWIIDSDLEFLSGGQLDVAVAVLVLEANLGK